MYHRTDHDLNRQIRDLNRVKIPLTIVRVVVIAIGYVALLPVVTYITTSTSYEIVLYIYLLPLAPIVFITYMTFTGKLKWLIKAAHKLQILALSKSNHRRNNK